LISTPKFTSRIVHAAWIVPIAGFLTTYLLAAGVSLSNVDIRSQAEIVGLLALAVCPTIGLVLTWRAGAPRAGVIVNLLLAVLVLMLAWITYASKWPPVHTPLVHAPTTEASRQRPVWIDTDPACGSGEAADVDDCWALALALRSPELQVMGISTVFGNQPRGRALSGAQRADIARSILERANRNARVFIGSDQGSDAEWSSTPASEALASTLARFRLSVLALGPVTNVATTLVHHPNLAQRIDRIVMVAGKPPGRLFHPGKHWWFHFGDFNVARDVEAMRTVLYSGVPITLVPFELAVQIVITDQDMKQLHAHGRLASWLAEASEEWLAFWQGRLIENPGFNPFDAAAVGYVALPGLFKCRDMRARIGSSVFLAPFGLGRDLEVSDNKRGAPVRYCDSVDARFKSILLERLSD
jgi:inosine-uridine nucleoside N-ribohydrolase